MTSTSLKVLAEFERLDASEKQEVVLEILRRSISSDELSLESLDEMALDLFRGYDTEEDSSDAN